MTVPQMFAEQPLTSSMRQFAPKVLAIWLASWAIVTLHPCCESILASSESHHGSQQSSHHSDHHDTDHHAAADTGHHDSAHDCRIAIENLDDLAVPVTDAFVAKYELVPDIDVVFATTDLLVLVDNNITSYVYHFTHPPPGGNQLYLSTLRIRV